MPRTILFRDRISAGEELAELVSAQIGHTKHLGCCAPPIVYALPRGGIPVAVPVARKLGCPLDVFVTKKITLPNNPELAIGAVTADGNVLWGSRQLLRKISIGMVEAALAQAREKAAEQLEEFKPYRPKINTRGAIAIIVDDGIATGLTMAAAAESMRTSPVMQVWSCAPVAPQDLNPQLERESDRTIFIETPHPFFSVSRFYLEFPQVSAAEAIDYLQQYNDRLLVSPSQN